MGNVTLVHVEDNVEGRSERAPLGSASYLFNLTGIIGNILVLHVFRKRINASSNYTIFIMFLSVVDLITCIAYCVKELHRMRFVYDQASTSYPFLCKFGHYVGNSFTLSSLLFVNFIAFEMYRKICRPFKPQITINCAKIMCACAILISLAESFPIYLMYGRRYVLVGKKNATRCAIQNRYDEDLLPILHYSLFLTVSLISIVLTVILQIRIQIALVNKDKFKQKRKCILSTLSSESEQETSKKPAADQDSERSRRIAFRFAFISMFLIVSVITPLVYQAILVARRYFYPRQRISKLEDVVEEYLPDIGAFNGILNPFVYLFTDNEFRQELKKMCGRTT